MTPALPDSFAEPAPPAPAGPAASTGGHRRRSNRPHQLPAGRHLKGRIEQAADRDGLSVNSWLTRAAAAAIETGAPARVRNSRARSRRPSASPAGCVERPPHPSLSPRQPSRRNIMPKFEHPRADLGRRSNLAAATPHHASDRTDTVVEVRPSTASMSPDVRPPSRRVSNTPTAGCSIKATPERGPLHRASQAVGRLTARAARWLAAQGRRRDGRASLARASSEPPGQDGAWATSGSTRPAGRRAGRPRRDHGGPGLGLRRDHHGSGRHSPQRDRRARR